MFEHAILMDTRFVRESIGADDGLVRLHRETGDARYQARSRDDLRGIDARVAAKKILARTHRHHHFFQGSIAGTFAQAIDGAFDLARAVEHGRQ